MELVTQMEEEAGRFAGETTSGSEEEVGGNQEVGDVGGVDFSGDGGVVAGRSGVFEDSLVVWGEPQELEDGAVKVFVGGAEVV